MQEATGYVYKVGRASLRRGKKKKLQKRWLKVMPSGIMSFHKSEESRAVDIIQLQLARGCDLLPAAPANVPSAAKSGFYFYVETAAKMYTLAAESVAERGQWISIVNAHINNNNNSGGGANSSSAPPAFLSPVCPIRVNSHLDSIADDSTVGSSDDDLNDDLDDDDDSDTSGLTSGDDLDVNSSSSRVSASASGSHPLHDVGTDDRGDQTLSNTSPSDQEDDDADDVVDDDDDYDDDGKLSSVRPAPVSPVPFRALSGGKKPARSGMLLWRSGDAEWTRAFVELADNGAMRVNGADNVERASEPIDLTPHAVDEVAGETGDAAWPHQFNVHCNRSNVPVQFRSRDAADRRDWIAAIGKRTAHASKHSRSLLRSIREYRSGSGGGANPLSQTDRALSMPLGAGARQVDTSHSVPLLSPRMTGSGSGTAPSSGAKTPRHRSLRSWSSIRRSGTASGSGSPALARSRNAPPSANNGLLWPASKPSATLSRSHGSAEVQSAMALSGSSAVSTSPLLSSTNSSHGGGDDDTASDMSVSTDGDVLAELSGFLSMCDGGTIWKRRHFTLQGRMLSYRRDARGDVMGVLLLRDLVSVQPASALAVSHFRARLPSDASILKIALQHSDHFLVADSEVKQQRWLEAIAPLSPSGRIDPPDALPDRDDAAAAAASSSSGAASVQYHSGGDDDVVRPPSKKEKKKRAKKAKKHSKDSDSGSGSESGDHAPATAQQQQQPSGSTGAASLSSSGEMSADDAAGANADDDTLQKYKHGADAPAKRLVCEKTQLRELVLCTFEATSLLGFFRMFFSDEDQQHAEFYHTKRGDRAFQDAEWQLANADYGRYRKVQYMSPVRSKLASKNETRQFEEQHYSFDASLASFRFETRSAIPDVPYGSDFVIENVWTVTSSGGNSVHLKIETGINFSKPPYVFIRKPIINGTMSESKESFELWCELAKAKVSSSSSSNASSSSPRQSGAKPSSGDAQQQQPLLSSPAPAAPRSLIDRLTSLEMQLGIALGFSLAIVFILFYNLIVYLF
jgi:VAD1 Analog of StAR-related lipid transfer domain